MRFPKSFRSWAPGLALIGALLATNAADASGAAASSHKSFKAGVYSAKTAQGSTFKFKVQAHSPTNHCGTRSTQHCFIAISYPSFNWSCGGAAATNAGAFPVANGFINAAGRFSYSQPLQGDSQPLLKFTATISGSKATGTLREKELTDDGSGSTVTCDSGTVKWSGRAG
jgi:hypothetical protein